MGISKIIERNCEMKISAIIGSLRKQNTYDTVKMIETFHQQYANCEYEYIFLKDIDLNLCTGCYVCITKEEVFCRR